MSGGAVIEVLPGVQVYPGVEIGEGALLEPPLVLGKPPRGREPGELKLVIGAGAVIRPFTTIYAGTVLGAGVQTGQCVSIREDNEIETARPSARARSSSSGIAWAPARASIPAAFSS